MNPQAAPGPISKPFDVMARYQDAYRIARAVNGLGILCKAAGFILGFLIIISGFIANANSQPNAFGVQQQTSTALILLAVIFGVATMVAGWVVGVIVSAQGQMLKATLDTAVYASPFLSDAQRATVMSVSETEAGNPNARHCPSCGAELKDYSKMCVACGTKFS